MEDVSVGRANAQGADIADIDFDLGALLQTVEVEDSPFGEYIMDCPVCKCAVRYFFVNFNEKFKMCENRDCDFPFGYEDLEFVKQDEMFASDDELDNITVRTRPTYTGSVVSTSAWSDVEKLNKADESDDHSDIPIRFESDAEKDAKLKELLRQKEAELQTKKNLQDIKKLNVQLMKTYEEDEVECIKNEKWIKHLRTLQSISGIQLLRKEELALINKEDLLGTQELTIGINTGDSSSSITINLAVPSNSTAIPMEVVEPTGID